jgi:hypothetical protein
LGNVSTLPTSAESLDNPVPANPSEPVSEGKRAGVRELWAAWKRVARKIGDFQARVLLTIFYFLLLAPFALVVRQRSDPLALKPGAPRGWGVRSDDAQYTVDMARKQF